MPRLRSRMYLPQNPPHHVTTQCPPCPISFNLQPFALQTRSSFFKNKAYHPSNFTWKTTSTPCNIEESRRDDIRLRNRRISLGKSPHSTTPQSPIASANTTEAQRPSPQSRSCRSRPGYQISCRHTRGGHVAIIPISSRVAQQSPVQ
jgi:hypothetical protein